MQLIVQVCQLGGANELITDSEWAWLQSPSPPTLSNDLTESQSQKKDRLTGGEKRRKAGTDVESQLCGASRSNLPLENGTPFKKELPLVAFT